MTSQLFESASLEEALAEVRDTVGPHAKIVRAEKVRRGGIAGFFAKESFVLAVENDAAMTPAAVPVVTVPERTLAAAPPLAWQQPAQADTWNDPYQDRFSGPVDTPAAYSLAALADFADRSDEVVESQPSAETPVSTETPLFGQVLRDVSRATTLDYQVRAEPRWDGPLLDLDEPLRSVMPLMSAPAAPVTPPVVHAPPAAVPYFQEQARVVVESPRPQAVRELPYEVLPAAPAQQPWWQTLAAVAETQAAQVAEVVQAAQDVAEAKAAQVAAAQAKAAAVPPAPVWIDLSAPRPPSPPSIPVQVFDPADDRLGDALFPPAPPATPEPLLPEPTVVPDPVSLADPVVIVRPMPTSGRPATPHQSTAQLAAGLATINAALGPALLPGSVIAVVGHPGDANKVAARVAVAASADPFAIHIASPDAGALQRSGLPTGRQVSTLAEAVLRSRRWPSRPTPLVVVIDGRDSHWARTVLDAIEATTVLALPSPAHQDDEVRDWVAELGGVQALLVDDTCASTPEALVLHGIPALRSPWSLESTRVIGDE